MLGQLAQPRERESRTPPAPRQAQPVNWSLRGCPAPGGGALTRRSLPPGARRCAQSGQTRGFPLETSEGDG